MLISYNSIKQSSSYARHVFGHNLAQHISIMKVNIIPPQKEPRVGFEGYKTHD